MAEERDDDDSTSDESLDATSENFDPLKALYSPKLKLMSLKAPVYDNISKFESVWKGLFKPKRDDANQGECSQPRFLPHQELVTRTRGRSSSGNESRGKNVLWKMQRALGPLGLLYACMQNKTRVKVYTRDARGIRGHVEAYVAAFDKHWNLALEDCFEVWTRKLKRKAPALGAPVKVKLDENSPRIVVKKTDGKTETLERHVPQMIVRGEQVAIIVKII